MSMAVGALGPDGRLCCGKKGERLVATCCCHRKYLLLSESGAYAGVIFFSEKDAVRSPIFPRFWECSVSATSCSIIYVHIPVMVLLEIHTDCQTSSGVAKGCQRMSRES